MHKTLSRLLALALGTVAGLGLAWVLWPLLIHEDPLAMGFHDGSKDLAELEDYLGKGGESFAGASRGPLGHLLLTAPVADRLFGFKALGLVYDPLAYYRRPPLQNARVKCPEHPLGAWWRRTNSLGLREDRELAQEQPQLRAFVTGDSHTDGVCNNSESFPHRLEALLSAALPTGSVEVLNAGVGGYSFYNYIGVFERYAEFKMDVFIVAVYGGNDFQNVITPYMFFHSQPNPGWGKSSKRLKAALEVDRSAMAQCFMAYAYFAEHPELEELAVDESVRATLELQRMCDEQGVALIVAYIPPMFEVQRESFADLYGRMSEVLELDAKQVQVTHRQARRYLAAMKEKGIRAVDLRPAFMASEVPLYWAHDHHINLAGHQLVADVLQPHVLGAWRKAQRASDSEH